MDEKIEQLINRLEQFDADPIAVTDQDIDKYFGEAARALRLLSGHPKESDATRGLYKKFRVERTDGRSALGEKHVGCEYFVLDLTHDPFAVLAIIAYAQGCTEKYPALARDLFAEAEIMEAALKATMEGEDG